jgi:hypothetical protein
MIELAHRQSIQIPYPSTIAIHCISGCLWVTQEGDSDDHILQAGESIGFAGRGLVVTSALRPSVLRLNSLHKNRGFNWQIPLALDPDAWHRSVLLPVGR